MSEKMTLVEDWHVECAIDAAYRADTYPGFVGYRNVAMRAALESFAATLPAFTLSQGFVDRVMEDEIEEPPVMGAGDFDSIKRIAEEMVHACKAYHQGDAEFTHDAVDGWAHRIMCFAAHVAPSSTLPASVPDAIDIDEVPSWVTKLSDPPVYVAGWNACREAMLTQRDAAMLASGER